MPPAILGAYVVRFIGAMALLANKGFFWGFLEGQGAHKMVVAAFLRRVLVAQHFGPRLRCVFWWGMAPEFSQTGRTPPPSWPLGGHAP